MRRVQREKRVKGRYYIYFTLILCILVSAITKGKFHENKEFLQWCHSFLMEQYPKGLGKTLQNLTQWLGDKPRIEKTTFSSCDEPKFCRQLTSDRPQVVLVGMEAHICILQTALALQAMGRIVFVAEDAVLSRNSSHKANALDRLRQAGIVVSNTESIVGEGVVASEGEAVKQISRLIR